MTKKEKNRTKMILIRVTEDEQSYLKSIAAGQKVTLSDFLLSNSFGKRPKGTSAKRTLFVRFWEFVSQGRDKRIFIKEIKGSETHVLYPGEEGYDHFNRLPSVE